MLAYHFTEMPYPHVPREVEKALQSARVIVPNSYLDARQVADLYNRYLDEYLLADDLGLEIMLNEHHQTLTCLDSVVTVSAGVLARQTRRAKIAIVGSPLPHRDNPLRVAEEIAMLDCISRGRIISGFVRGVPTEVQPANTNPTQTRERFEEAHDLIVKAWTTPEPFNWEGRFWHYRYVNVWPRPYQQPHPPIWVTGSSLENVPWVAERGYTFATLVQSYEHTAALFDRYRQHCAARGLPAPGPEKFAYAAAFHTADTDEQAYEEGRGLHWYFQSERHPQLNMPPGIVPPQVMAKFYLGQAARPNRESYEALQENGLIITGSPTTMIKRITHLYDRVGVGHLLMMNQAGLMPTHQVRHSLELFAKEVYPALRELGARPPALAGTAATP